MQRRIIQTSHTHGYYRPSRLLLFKAKTIISMAESDNPSLPDDVHEPDDLLDTFSVVGSMERLSVFDFGVITVRCGVFATPWTVVGTGVISGTVLSTVGVGVGVGGRAYARDVVIPVRRVYKG